MEPITKIICNSTCNLTAPYSASWHTQPRARGSRLQRGVSASASVPQWWRIENNQSTWQQPISNSSYVLAIAMATGVPRQIKATLPYLQSGLLFIFYFVKAILPYLQSAARGFRLPPDSWLVCSCLLRSILAQTSHGEEV